MARTRPASVYCPLTDRAGKDRGYKMKARRTKLKVLATLLAAVLLALPVLPAFAADGDVPPTGPTITAAVTVGGVLLQNKNAEEASAAIAAIETSFAPLPVTGDGHFFSLEATHALTLDVSATVAAAFAATETTTLAPTYVVDSSAVTAYAAMIARAIDRKAIDAKRVVSRRRLKISASRTGRRVDQARTVTVLTAALVSEASGAAVATVTVPVGLVRPRVTLANIGKTIIVSLGEFRVLLYKGAKIEHTYRCAIGMPAHPTPRGTFKVIAKSAAPTWRNPYSDWSMKMPAYIKPGYYNPLGLRALYLSAPGIRIHGTSKSYSMGHAASHGCIRLTNHSVVDIYPRVKVGTPVYIVK